RGSFIACLSEMQRRDASLGLDVGRPDHLAPLLNLPQSPAGIRSRSGRPATSANGPQSLLRALVACQPGYVRSMQAGYRPQPAPARQVSQSALGGATIRYMYHVHGGHHLEQFPGGMRNRAGTERGHAELTRVNLGIRDEFGKSVDRNR